MNDNECNFLIFAHRIIDGGGEVSSFRADQLFIYFFIAYSISSRNYP